MDHIELIDGREVEKSLPKKLHSFCEAHLIVKLAHLLLPRYIAAVKPLSFRGLRYGPN